LLNWARKVMFWIYQIICQSMLKLKFEQTITHQLNMYFYDGKVSRIDGASVTIILCLHVLIARHILLILIYWLFSVNIDV
jgi:hypothetical protein